MPLITGHWRGAWEAAFSILPEGIIGFVIRVFMSLSSVIGLMAESRYGYAAFLAVVLIKETG
jgi:hypothetical protein